MSFAILLGSYRNDFGSSFFVCITGSDLLIQSASVEERALIARIMDEWGLDIIYEAVTYTAIRRSCAEEEKETNCGAPVLCQAWGAQLSHTLKNTHVFFQPGYYHKVFEQGQC